MAPCRHAELPACRTTRTRSDGASSHPQSNSASRGLPRTPQIEFFKVARNATPDTGHGWTTTWSRGLVAPSDRDQTACRAPVPRRRTPRGSRLADTVRNRSPGSGYRRIPGTFRRTCYPPSGRDEFEKAAGASDSAVTSMIDVRRTGPARARRLPSAESALMAIHDWWTRVAPSERQKYDRTGVPIPGFCRRSFGNRTTVSGWFTMFALACFRSLGLVSSTHSIAGLH